VQKLCLGEPKSHRERDISASQQKQNGICVLEEGIKEHGNKGGATEAFAKYGVPSANDSSPVRKTAQRVNRPTKEAADCYRVSAD